ncbi:NAD(P)/FAD-dependent oxidoreductase [Aeromicrobium sp. 9AM]|uniref:NAD(P)/FAD-dependent oxidoreductase n=1 Tax=Aeromicrobium sp. 9AM TaxID=2653126 RepID=UPI0012F2523F|nr:FAD-dependent oxidoreductase [Aeromicrobium sp. 9AM]VXB07489.1 putative enzyme [Aeromicrobium sp. 9AM]
MKTDIAVVGGGFAGVWSAAAALRAARESDTDLDITLISPNDSLVIRPRLYEDQPELLGVPLEDIFGGTQLRRVKASVQAVDPLSHMLSIEESDGTMGTVEYRKLILATGSRLAKPHFEGADLLHDVDTMEGSIALDRHLRQEASRGERPTVVVVGAGFTGIEIATELVGRLADLTPDSANPAKVILVEREAVVGPDLGAGPRPVIEQSLADLGVDVLLGRTVTRVAPDQVVLDDGTSISARTVVWTAGIRASELTKMVSRDRDPIGRVVVDEFLRATGTPDVLVAGDTAAAIAEEGHTVMPSCQHAIPLGKFAGYNAVAAIIGTDLAPFEPAPYATCVDLGPAGAVYTTGWERTVQKLGAEAKAHKQRTNRERIYPPVRDAEELLRIADYKVSTRQQAVTPAS